MPHFLSPPGGVTGTSCYRFEYNSHLIKIPSHVNREGSESRTTGLSGQGLSGYARKLNIRSRIVINPWMHQTLLYFQYFILQYTLQRFGPEGPSSGNNTVLECVQELYYCPKEVPRDRNVAKYIEVWCIQGLMTIRERIFSFLAHVNREIQHDCNVMKWRSLVTISCISSKFTRIAPT